MTREQLQAVTRILKARFPNLTVEEVIDIAAAIIEAVESV
jgi:hypothetical protein